MLGEQSKDRLQGMNAKARTTQYETEGSKLTTVLGKCKQPGLTMAKSSYEGKSLAASSNDPKQPNKAHMLHSRATRHVKATYLTS